MLGVSETSYPWYRGYGQMVEWNGVGRIYCGRPECTAIFDCAHPINGLNCAAYPAMTSSKEEPPKAIPFATQTVNGMPLAMMNTPAAPKPPPEPEFAEHTVLWLYENDP